MVFREIVQGGLGWLAVVVAVNTVIGPAYYIAWTARLFTPPAAGDRRAGPVPVVAAAALAVLVTIAFSVAPQMVLSAVD